MDKYKALLEISIKFPFLAHSIKNNLFEVYSLDEILDYETFIKNYDTSTDLFKLAKQNIYTLNELNNPVSSSGTISNTFNSWIYGIIPNINFKYRRFNFLHDEEKYTILYNFLFEYTTISKKLVANNPNLYAKIACEILESIGINEILAEPIHEITFDADKGMFSNTEDPVKDIFENKNRRLAYIFDECNCIIVKIMYDFLNGYLARTGKKRYKIIEDIMNTDEDNFSNIDRLLEYIINFEKYFTKLNDRQRFVPRQNTLSERSKYFKEIFEYISDTFTNEELEILNKQLVKFKSINKFLNRINDEGSRAIKYENDKYEIISSIYNPNNKTIDLSSYKNLGKLKEIATELCEINKNGKIPAIEIKKTIDEMILNNKNIRDKDFPVTKDKVVHEFLFNLFNNSRHNLEYDVDEMTNIFDAYEDYFYDPYFITSIVIRPTFITENYGARHLKKLVADLFVRKEKIVPFINKYLDELNKDPSQRKCTVKTINEKSISYGILRYIINKVGFNFNYNIEEIYSNMKESDNRLMKLLWFTYNNSDFIKYTLQSICKNSVTDKSILNSDIMRDKSRNIACIYDLLFCTSQGKVGMSYNSSDTKIAIQKYSGAELFFNYYLTNTDFDERHLRTINTLFENWSYKPTYSASEINYAFKLISFYLYQYMITKLKINSDMINMDDIKNILLTDDTSLVILPDNSISIRYKGINEHNYYEKDNIVAAGKTFNTAFIDNRKQTFNAYGSLAILTAIDIIDLNNSNKFFDDISIDYNSVFLPDSSAVPTNVWYSALLNELIESLHNEQIFNTFKPLIIDNLIDKTYCDTYAKPVLVYLTFVSNIYKKHMRNSYFQDLNWFYGNPIDDGFCTSTYKFYEEVAKNNALISKETLDTIKENLDSIVEAADCYAKIV